MKRETEIQRTMSSCYSVILFLIGCFHLVKCGVPTFSAIGTVTVAENIGIGVSVTTVTATDPNGFPVAYSIQSQNPGSKFTIGTSSGVISTTAALDYETDKSYTITISANPTNDISAVGTQTVSISVTDVNDNKPVFSPSVYYASVQENSASGISVVLLTVSDTDTSSTVTVTIASGDDATNKFTVNGKEIRTSANAIDYDVLSSVNYRYTLVVEATDGTFTATASVFVTVTNVNEHTTTWDVFSPAYTDATTPYNLPENSAIGTTIVTIAASDADAGVDGQILYSLGTITPSSSTTTTGLFNLDQVSGILTTTSASFDRDPNTGGVEYYDVIVKAVDQGSSPKSVERTVRIALVDVNDNTPTFSQNIYTVTIPETTAAGTSLLTLTASDNDVAFSLSYSIESSSLPSTYATYFELDSTVTNQLNLKAVADLDLSVSSTFNLVIKVVDAVTSPRSSTTKVTISIISVNEFDPVFQADFATSIDEDAAIGDSVATITATDDDVGDDGAISYSITGGNSAGKFTINPSTGEILLAKTLDFEVHTAYILTIVATDGGATARTDTASVTVNVNDVSDEEPTCTSYLLSTTVNEPGAVNDYVVDVSCSDDDAVDTLSYSIASGDSTGKFTISNTGQISLAANLDYEDVTSYSLVVEVTDGTTILEVLVNVAVGPTNEYTPTFGANVDVTFAENTAVGTSLVTFSASDDDDSPHNIKRYQITSVTNSGSGIFSIDSSTGEIRLAKTLDYETTTSYVITVTAVDGGTPALTGTGTVTIQVSNFNDVTPTCTPAAHVISLAEDTATSTDVIASFGCSDVDSATLTYTITSQSTANFILNGSPPTLRLNAALDYETADSFELEVTVSDGPLSTIVYIDVAVTDVNDGAPTFSSTTYTTSVPENAAIGYSVATYTASDPDSVSSSFGKLYYSIINGNAAKKFNINPNSGKVSVIGVLNADVTPSYALVIQAVEASGVNSATATVSITVTDVNDNVPTCTSDLAFSVTKAEPGAAGDVIFALMCTDADGDPLTYTMTSGDSTYFEMSSSNLQLKSVIDYDTVSNPQFDFEIEVSDGTNTLDVTGTLLLTGINEHTPVFSMTTYSVTRSESASPGSLITTVTATDADKGDTVSYDWVSSPTSFTLDRTSGEILLVAMLDRETTPSYSLLVTASDGTNVATATVTVTVLDVNDNTPTFNPNAYSSTISEADPAGTTVATMTATDADDPATNNYGTITYSITSGNNAGRFTINTSTGVIVTAVTLDYEVATSYTLYVRAIDSGGGGGARSSTAVVTVNVSPVNEDDPTFTSSSFSATVDEDLAVGSSILTADATDTDKGDDGDVYYTMNTNAKFFLDRDTGEVFLKEALDYETATSHTFDVVAHDSGTSPRSATVTVTITVGDVNDNTPTCVPNLNTLTYAENYGSTITALTCSDGDHTSPNNALAYTIVSVNGGVSSTPFAVSGTGVLSLDIGQSFDYETTKSYNVLVRVYDGGSPIRSSTATVKVDITDVNENSPVFSSGTSFTLSEITAVSTSVFKVIATDADTAQNVYYSISPSSPFFGVDSNNGDIILTSPLDYDTLATNPLNVVVVATDDGTTPSVMSASVTLTVTVLDDNDVTPVFLPAVYSATISENDDVGTTVVTVTATDSDDASLTYSLVNGFSLFSIDSSGVISIQFKTQDYETTKSYTLVVHAVDPALHTGSTTVYVQISAYNEHSPIFTSASLSVSVPENSALDTVIADTDADDADDGSDGLLTYTISAYPAGFQDTLSIDPSTGIVRVAANIDRESVATNPLSFTISATDSGTSPGALTATFTMAVTITDVNDVTPVCSSSLYSTSIPENSAIGVSVAQLTCTDADATAPNNDISTYTFVSGNAGGEFLISSTGEVTTTVFMDREAVASYLLEIRVADSGTTPSVLTTTTTLSIIITDVNDNTPTFSLSVYNFNQDEDIAVGTVVGTVTATDDDSGLAGSISYSIASGNTDGKFAMDKSTGQLKLVSSLDYEMVTTYTLVVHAIDKEVTFRTGTATVSVTVNAVNDNAPVCSSALFIGSVNENAATGTSVVTVVCSDADVAVGNTLSYSIISAHTEFVIDSTTGVMTTNTALNIETISGYDVIIQVSDGTFFTDVTARITLVDVNDNIPAFSPSGPYVKSIQENIAIGSTIYDINATDADVTPTSFAFSITGGDPAGKFRIGTSSGIIQTQVTIDRDNPLVTSYTLTVQVSDGTNTASTSIVITITDENDNYPSCDATTYDVTTLESTATGTTLFSPVCSDLDVSASPTLLYSIWGGNGDSKFQINSGSGILTTQNTLDYETTTQYTLTVHVSDQGTPALTTTLTMIIYVDPVNENTPAFQGTPYDISIDEDEASGYQVVRISATDSDTGSTHGTVRYAITSGNTAGHFSINPSTGWIQVSGPLDRETTASYSLTVTAADMTSGDASAMTASNTFVITINDINDNYPVINPSSYATVINENLGSGGSVVQVLATDDDSGLAGTSGLRYSITGGNTGNVFSINGGTGWITLDGNVDANTQSVYILNVQVADQGTPVRSASTIVTIEVVAVNEHAPTFSVAGFTVTLPESETVGNSIYQVAGSDMDTGSFAVLRYFIQSGNTDNAFAIDLFDGTVRVANKLNYDAPPSVYNLVIIVHDTEQSTSSTRTATMTLTVSLTDFNDITPAFSTNTYATDLDENTAVGTSVITVTATDGDSGTNGAVTYSIVSGTGSTSFTIDASSGLISTGTSIDYELLTSYDLVVRAADGGTPSLTSSCLVRISIVDINDNIPVFLVSNVAVSISEATSVATTVATARATDADSSYNNNNVIQYAISPTSNRFTIDVTSGAITVTNALDRETAASHTLYIVAKDQGTLVQKSGTATYTIVILDENDSPPVVVGTYDTSVAENAAVNTIVFDVTATDADMYENSVLTFTITNGNTDNDFYIDTSSGIIQILNSLDRERTDQYLLEVTISDNGATPLVATITATITISDINDNPPVFQPSPISAYHFSVSENVPSGTVVDQVSATDADTGVNGAVTYTRAYAITGSFSHFALDSSTGVITTAASLDRETQDTYVFVIRADDGGTNTLMSTVTVTITIIDYNDNDPTFNQSLYTATIDENQPVGTSILTLVIDDVDIDVNDDIVLSISDTTASLYIGANSSNYILYVKSPIDRETLTTISFVLTATDQGTPPRSYTTSVVITIGDVNDNAPVFSPTFYNSEIAYNDDCQTTVATISATDIDDGVNADITYYTTLNNQPHLFSLDSSTGDVKMIANSEANTGYKIYAAARDSGSPSLNSSTGATIRVDTYIPDDVMLNYYMNISRTSYLAMEATFLNQLTTVYRQTYNQTLARRWCIIQRTASTCTVRIYIIKNNNDTDEVGEINTAKEYLTKDEAYAITAADDAGTPAGVITGIAWSSFVITKVEKFAPDPEEEATPWIKTTVGIVTVSVLSVLMFALLVTSAVVAMYKMKSPYRESRNRVDVTVDDEGDKNQYQSKNNTTRRHAKHNMIQADNLKSFDKNHLPPPVVAFPMPTATKPKDINLIDPHMDGPTLIKKPEKLRPGSPVQTESILTRRKLSPTSWQPLPKPPKPDSLYDDFPGDTSNYMVSNRVFGGRAIDPVSGRLYEYNTQTNERRWVSTPDW